MIFPYITGLSQGIRDIWIHVPPDPPEAGACTKSWYALWAGLGGFGAPSRWGKRGWRRLESWQNLTDWTSSLKHATRSVATSATSAILSFQKLQKATGRRHIDDLPGPRHPSTVPARCRCLGTTILNGFVILFVSLVASLGGGISATSDSKVWGAHLYLRSNLPLALLYDGG